MENSTQTPSERYLTTLARTSFLTLWSYPNLYTDESKRVTGDGKEFCDLTVVFGDRVLLFSDKHVRFSIDRSIEVAWPRWYRRAITNSAKQLFGAESWIRRFPDRIFLDRSCNNPIPHNLSQSTPLRVHKIVIANGASEAVARHLSKSVPSLRVSTADFSDDRGNSPFTAFQPFKSRGHVHIFDETTLEIVLRELDTVGDFVRYLDERERVSNVPGMTLRAFGEEDILAIFMTTTRELIHQILPGEGFDLTSIPDGLWKTYVSSPERALRAEANRISYKWDELIESFTSHILSDRRTSPMDIPLPSVANQERGIRQMAAENRIRRRQLGRWIMEGAEIAWNRPRFARTIAFMQDEPKRGYAVYFQKPREAQAYGEYRHRRLAMLYGYVLFCKMKYKQITSVIGIAAEGRSDEPGTEDLLFLDCANWTPTDEANAVAMIEKLQIGKDPSKLVPRAGSEREFPPRGR